MRFRIRADIDAKPYLAAARKHKIISNAEREQVGKLLTSVLPRVTRVMVEEDKEGDALVRQRIILHLVAE